MNDSSSPAEPRDARVQVALGEYLDRVDRGEAMDPEKYIAQHPEIAVELRSFIAAEDQLLRLAQAGSPDERAGKSTQSFVLHGQETIVPQAEAKRSTKSDAIGLKQEFGRYRIVKALGKGAMGTVYLAEDTQLQRQVALKMPHFEQETTPELLERFYREARAAATLRHPNICPVYDVGQIDETHYISMAYIEGHPLSAFVRPPKPQPERQILIVVRKLAQGLQEAHDHGIVHRDLKPANVMVDKRSEPIIMDFGLARQLQREKDIRITQSGMLIGTPAYMSPEQIEGEPDKIGPPSDQYSLGVILYELLTGQLPFRGSLTAVMAQIITKETTPPGQLRPGLDPRIEAVCLKMMAKVPADRFASLSAAAEEMAAILRTLGAKPKAEDTGGPVGTGAPAHRAAEPSESKTVAAGVPQSLKKMSMGGKELASLGELAGKCLARHDYEQVIQIVERIPEEKRDAGLQALLEDSRAKADEIAFLICEIDEAVRFHDRGCALKKAEELLKIKPGHHRALQVQKELAGYREGGAARIGPLQQFTRPWNEGGWIPWGVLAFGLAVFAAMLAVVVVYLGRTAVLIDITDPGVTVAIKGTILTVTGPDKQSVKVVPGDQELTITCAGLETKTKSFTIKRGETKAVTVSIVSSQLIARLENEIAPSIAAREEQPPIPTAGGKKPLAPLTPAHGEQTATTLRPTFTNGLGMEFVLVPKGKSWLAGGGGKPGDKEVVIANDFYLGKYEVTQEDWKKVTGLTPSGFSRTGGRKDAVKDIADVELKRFPVESVSWDDAQLFLERLNKGEKDAGWVYRLPKEAEWEYACRGGPLSDKFESAYDFYFDKPANQLLPEQANFEHGKALKRPCKVGLYRPNRLGLYDMQGNVHEWCDDSWVPATSGRVFRGGSWYSARVTCQAAWRFAYPPSERVNDIGLRLARVPVGAAVVKIPPEEKQTAVVAPDPSAPIELLDAIMLKCQKKIGCSGATLTIARGDQILYSRGYGSSDRDGKVPIQPNTPMCISGCDAPFIGAAARQLVQQGKLDPHASVLKLLKIKPARRVVDHRVWDITVAHLIEHKAGWHGTPLDRARKAANGKKHAITAPTLLACVMCEKLAGAPGTKAEFEWFDLDVLRWVIARASGRRYVDYLRYELCRPHGINELKWIRDAGPRRKDEPPRLWNGLILEDAEEYRMGVSTPAMCTFMRFFWLDGRPRDNGNPLWTWNGSWSNSTTSMIWRSDGINVAWSFNGAANTDPGQELWLHAIDQLKKDRRFP